MDYLWYPAGRVEGGSTLLVTILQIEMLVVRNATGTLDSFCARDVERYNCRGTRTVASTITMLAIRLLINTDGLSLDLKRPNLNPRMHTRSLVPIRGIRNRGRMIIGCLTDSSSRTGKVQLSR